MDLTALVVTKNRPSLAKTLDHLGDTPRVVVSNHSRSLVTDHFEPGLILGDLYAYGVGLIKTKYTVLAEDDDYFISKTILKQAVDALQRSNAKFLIMGYCTPETLATHIKGRKKINKGIYSVRFLLENFPHIFKDGFQFGQIVWETARLKLALGRILTPSTLTLTHNDERAFLQALEDCGSQDEVIYWPEPYFVQGIGSDNYSMGESRVPNIIYSAFVMYHQIKEKYIWADAWLKTILQELSETHSIPAHNVIFSTGHIDLIAQKLKEIHKDYLCNDAQLNLGLSFQAEMEKIIYTESASIMQRQIQWPK